MRLVHSVFALAASTLPMSVAVAAQPVIEQRPVAAGEVSGRLLTVSPSLVFDSATLRIAGPGGYELIAWSQGEPFAVDLLAAGSIAPSDGMPGGQPLALPEGRYGYEVVFYLESGERRVHSGSFRVVNGVAESVRDGAGAGAVGRAEPAPDPETEESNGLATKAGSTGEYFVIDDTANDGETSLQLRADNPDGTLINYWGVRNETGDLRLSTSPGGNWVDEFTFKAAGQLGIGTTQPQADLHIYRPGGNIRITDSDACPNPNAAWEIEEDFGKLKFEVVPNCPDDSTGGKMWITGGGRVGIGTHTPGKSLHIDSLNPAVRLSQPVACPSLSASWDLVSSGSGGFFDLVSVPHCGEASAIRMTLTHDGRLGIGEATPNARLHVVGDAIVEGDVAFGSSRTIKHDLAPLDGGGVLEALRQLPLFTWKYREDDLQALHAGPMAEDVHAVFGLGRDERHLSPADSAGLALAAIQGLDREVTALRAENAELADRNRELLERLTALEERLAEPSGDL